MNACVDHGYTGGLQGYASVRRPTGRDPKVILHRWLFIQAHGWTPEAVMHTCDNPRCINLDHLVGGTRAENNRDRAARGRSAQNVPSRRKLTLAQAEEIRARYVHAGKGKKTAGPNGVSALAKEFRVDPNVIYQIVQGRTHRA